MKTEMLLAAGGAAAFLLWGKRPASAQDLGGPSTTTTLAPVRSDRLPIGPLPTTPADAIERTVTGEVVPFWNGTGIQLGNGNMILPDGRVVTPDQATLIVRLREMDTTPWRPSPIEGPAPPDPTRAIIKAALKTVLNPNLIIKATSLAGFTSASQAIAQGVALGDVGGVVGVAISIGFTLASEMPGDMMAVSIALDVLNLALAFIPVVGWALALIAGMFKSSIVKLFAPDLTHEQRELMELSRVLQKTKPLYDYYVRRAVSPTQLYEGIALYNRGDLTHEREDSVAIDLRYLSVDGRMKVIRPSGATPRADGRVLHGGGWVVPGTPQDFVTSVGLIPEGLFVRIQAGVALEMLTPAEDYHAIQIQRRCRMILEAQHASAEALKVLSHIWHMTRDPVVNVRLWLEGSQINPDLPANVQAWEGTIPAQVPLLAEVLLSLYYSDIALVWGFTRQHPNGAVIGDWQQLVGVVTQPMWTEYHRLRVHAGDIPTLSGFLTWLDEPDVMTLRRRVFNGAYPVDGTQGVAMFEQIANDLKMLNANLDVAWRRACLAEPYPYPEKNFQGLYRGYVSTEGIQARYTAWISGNLGTVHEITPTGVINTGVPLAPDYGWGTG